MAPTREGWIRALRASDLFRELDEAALVQLVGGFEEKELRAGEYVVRQNDEAESLFVVMDGRVEVLLEGETSVPLQWLGAGSVIGEMALVMGGKRSASARAVEPTRVIELPRERFTRMLDEHPELLARLSDRLRQNLRRASVAGHLRDLFGALDPERLRAIEEQVTWVSLPSGRELFRQGDKPDGAYLVVVGRLRVAVRTGSGEERVIDESGPGTWVGEMALLTGTERSATVYAIRDTEVIWLSQAAFDELVLGHPRAMRETARALVTRLQRRTSAEAAPRAEAKTFVVVPTAPGVNVDGFSADLVSALRRYGTVLHLTAEAVDAYFGKKGFSRAPSDDPAQLRLGPWLIDQEARHTFVVFQADDRWSGWTERAVRHGDHVLLVADSRSSTRTGEVEHRLAATFAEGRSPKQSLVLLQTGQSAVFHGTSAWLSSRRVSGHHHVRAGRKADVARVARLLTGHAVGLVLGGGGSRGYAHIGVVRAFEELGIPVDAVGGTSMGALVGATLALGFSWRDMLRTLPPRLVRSFANITLPWVSLLSGRVAMKELDDLFGTVAIEDLATPYFGISTNLTHRVEVVHRRGPLSLAVRASVSLPGILPPLPHEGDLLVDGVFSNNVPVDRMLSLFGGSVVAVDVLPDIDLPAGGPLPMSLSGWSVAYRRLNPFAEDAGVPDIGSILLRSATTATHITRGAERFSKLAALYLRPPSKRWNILNFRSAPPVADEGYESTIGEIRAWWERDRATLMGSDGSSS